MLVLTVSASVPTSYYHADVRHTVVYLGLYLTALGSGGIKPCASAFGADQFDSADPMELAEKGSFFNWYYFLISLGSLLSSTVLVWLQDNVGWGVSFAIPTVLMVLGLAVFVGGSRVYRFRKPRVSPFTSLCQVVVAAVRQRHMQLPDDNSLLYELTSSSSAAESSHKIQHTNQFRYFKPASLSIFGVLSSLIWVYIYETVLVPLARRYTGKAKGFSQMQRLGTGFALSMLTMVYSAILEMKRLAIAQASGLAEQNVPVPMSILWQAPSYVLKGAAGVFAGIGMLEFFYDQAPYAMKSLCAAFAQLAVASGAYFNTLIFAVVAVVTTQGGEPGWIPDNLNEGHLDYFFWMMAALSLLNLVQFLHYSRKYSEKTTS